MSTNSLPPNSPHRDLHFDLSWLGPIHETGVYMLHVGGRPYRLARHTPETLAASSAAGSPTHFATPVAVQTDTPRKLNGETKRVKSGVEQSAGVATVDRLCTKKQS